MLRDLKRQLAQMRKQGYALILQNQTDFLSSLLAPIKDFSGKGIAAAGIDGPTFRSTNQNLKKLKQLLLASTTKIS
jgi:DNA-binding IclR family transcriptional regulator